ncbi:MAG: hypothetical protein ACLFVT_05905 [Syntrophobacteria bacterium]
MNEPDGTKTGGGGIFLDPCQIDFEAIDPPLRRLVRLINSRSWARTYGCCAGPAYHGEDPGEKHQFYIGLFVRADSAGMRHLRSWLDEANRINGSTGVRAALKSVPRHPFGQDGVAGWYACRLAIDQVHGTTPSQQQAFLRMIKSLKIAWDTLWTE